MGINVSVQKSPKAKDIISASVKLERDLKGCMRCRFFYGNNSQCIANRCIKENLKSINVQDEEDICFECPYRQSERYCFPCMKRLLGMVDNEQIRKGNDKADRGS